MLPDPGARPDPAPAARLALAALLLVLAGGVALRVWAWISAPSLWFDEIAIALNLRDRNLWELVSRPLAWHQVAPGGFLALEAVARALFGEGERALRLPALVGGTAGLLALPLLARRLVSNSAALLATALAAASPFLVRYANEVKPYGIDFAAGVVLPWLALRWRNQPGARRGRALALAAACFSVIGFGGVLAGAAVGAVLVVAAWRGGRAARRRALAVALPGPLVGVGTVWLAGVLLPASDRAFLAEFWARGLLDPGRGWTALFWPLERLRALALDLLGAGGVRVGDALALLLLYGVLRLFRTQAAGAALLFAPAAAALGAGVVGALPFEGRLALVAVPALAIGIASGAERAVRFVLRREGLVFAVLAALSLAGGGTLAATTRPAWSAGQHGHELMDRLRTAAEPGDAVYVFFAARPAWELWAARSWSGGEVVEGGCHGDEPWRYLEEIDRLRGSPRAWVVLTHSGIARAARGAVLGYLETIGTRLGDFQPDPGDEGERLLLYALDDPRRLASADASSYRLPPRGRFRKRPCGFFASP